MRIAVVGIGGIGGYIASKLCKAAPRLSIEVVFVQRGEHKRAIEENGLTYITKFESVVRPSLITDEPCAAGLFDVVIFNIKSRDLEDAARSVCANLHENTILLSTLNGVNNASRLRAVYPSLRVLNGCIYVSAFIERPGVVRQVGGAGNLIFGPEDGGLEPYKFLADLFVKAEIKAVLSDNILNDVWSKYIFICSWATISCKYQLPVGALLSQPAIVNEWKSLIREISILGSTFGIDFGDSAADACIERAAKLPYDNKTSMQLDIEQGKKPELDVFTAFVVETGREKGVETPVHNEMLEKITSLIR